jgi:hypothetical protein
VGRKTDTASLLRILIPVAICGSCLSLSSCIGDPAWVFMEEPFARFLGSTHQTTQFVDTLAIGEIELTLKAVSHWDMKDPEYPYELALIYDIKLLSEEGTLELHEDKIVCSYYGEALKIRDVEIRRESEHRSSGEVYFQHRNKFDIDATGSQFNSEKTASISIDMSKAVFHNDSLVSVMPILAND